MARSEKRMKTRQILTQVEDVFFTNITVVLISVKRMVASKTSITKNVIEDKVVFAV